MVEIIGERTINPISHSYWRSLKRGNRTYESITREPYRTDVLYLAKSDVINGVITAEEYEYYIGVPFEE